ncbi:MAG: hypothetical protein IJ981_03090 [Clostridia bacterium]|nr:hypothetical protein [Clostridia bacterium]
MSELDKYKTENKVKNPLEDYWTSYVKRTYGAPNLTGVDYNVLTDAQKSQYDADKKIADRYALLQGIYESGVQSTEKDRAIDLQNDYINSQLAQKYMPIYLKKAGIDNLGIAQSTISELGTNYANLVAQTNREKDAELSKLRDDHSLAMYELMGEHQTATDTVKAQNEANAIALMQQAFDKLGGKNGLTESEYTELTKAYQDNIGSVTNPVDRKKYEDMYNALYKTNKFSAYDMTNPTAMLDDIYKKWNNGEYSNVEGLEATLNEIQGALDTALNSGSLEKKKYDKYVKKIDEIRTEANNTKLQSTNTFIPDIGFASMSTSKQLDTISKKVNKLSDNELLLAKEIALNNYKKWQNEASNPMSVGNNQGFLITAEMLVEKVNNEIKRRGL